MGSSESNKRYGLKDAVASWGRRKEFKMSLYGSWYRTKDRILCDNKRNATGLVSVVV